jgi:polysaccharide biosynthesis/export protein ExoF
LTILYWTIGQCYCLVDLVRKASTLLIVSVFLMTPLSVASAAEYRLGPSDKLAIKVVEWQAAEGTFRDWPSLAGEYTVSPSGTLSIPFGGEIQAGGKTTSEVSSELSKALQQKLGLVVPPEASVQVSEFRPIFVTGDVQSPGKHPFSPDVTVMKAVSLSGGLRRSTEANQRFEREFVNARGSYDVLVTERDRLLVRRARLQAELANSAAISRPPDLSASATPQKLLAEETAIMQSRKNALDLQLNAMDELKKLYSSEIASLEKKMTVQSRQMELMRKELANIGGLADKGLVVSSRVMALETAAADLESKLLDLGTASLRAKQEISKANQSATNLENGRKAELAAELQKTEASLDENRLRISMYKDLMTEVAVSSSTLLDIGNTFVPSVQYTVVRLQNGEPSEIPANENTSLIPGDVIRVVITHERPKS